MSSLHVDGLVVGGGPAGTPLAMAPARAVNQVLPVEDGPGPGGTFLFHGCIPSRILRESARVRSLVTRAVEFGITRIGGVPAVDRAAIHPHPTPTGSFGQAARAAMSAVSAR